MGAGAVAGPVAVVVLAAGQGTRMRSDLPKVLHEVAGRPMLAHVLAAARGVDPERLVVVVGHRAELVRARLDAPDVRFVEQSEQRGTGHALACARDALEGFRGTLVVVNGDAPLLEAATLRRLVEEHARHGDPTLLTFEVRDPTGLGRVIRDADGAVERVVEEKDATDAERALREIYPGMCALDEGVFEVLDGLGSDNRAKEYYLTGLVALYRERGRTVRAVRGEGALGELVGVNTRAELAVAERLLRDRVRTRWLAQGVSLQAPETIFLDDDVVLARDVVLEPGVVLRGATRVGEGARIGAYAVLDGCVVEAGARVPPHTVATGRTLERA